MFSIRSLRLYFPMLEPWVVWSVSLSHHSSRFICMRMWDCLLHQLPPRCESSPPGCPSPPLLPSWVSVSSLSPWLLDLHTVRFSVSSDCFLFLNCYCPSFGCIRRHSVSTYTSIFARSRFNCGSLDLAPRLRAELHARPANRLHPS